LTLPNKMTLFFNLFSEYRSTRRSDDQGINSIRTDEETTTIRTIIGELYSHVHLSTTIYPLPPTPSPYPTPLYPFPDTQKGGQCRGSNKKISRKIYRKTWVIRKGWICIKKFPGFFFGILSLKPFHSLLYL